MSAFARARELARRETPLCRRGSDVATSREDSSEPRKTVWTPPWLPGSPARTYVCCMNNAHRVAIVTGASRGIGAGLVAGYRRLGFRVVATSRSIAPSNDEHVLATHDFLAKLMPVGRMGDVQDVVDAVLYLESASFVTGEIVHVDGGEAAGVG